MTRLERFDEVMATFQPQRTDDLRGGADAWIGRRMKWMVAWKIEPADGGAYVGRYAMTPMVSEPTPFAWVPDCDLADVTPV